MQICVEEVRVQKFWMQDGQCYHVCGENLLSIIACVYFSLMEE